MNFNAHTIILTVVILLILYFLYQYFYTNSRIILVRMQDATTQSTVSPASTSIGDSVDYTFSIWFYINDWNYKIGQEKVIFERRATSENKPAPSVSLGANTNNLNVAIETYSASGVTQTSNCQISDIPLQRWTNFIMSINGRALDLYIDGKLVRTCVLEGPPKSYSNTPIEVCPGKGFSGFVSNLEYISNSISPSEAYNIYKEGYGGSSMFGLLNKYRLKMAFLEGNRELKSFEL